MMLPPRLKSGELDALFKKGNSLAGKLMRIVYSKNGVGKISYLSPKKLGNAVIRNHTRRMLKESIIMTLNQAIDMDLAIVAKPAILQSNLIEISLELKNLLVQIGSKRYSASLFSLQSNSTGKCSRHSNLHLASTPQPAPNMLTKPSKNMDQ